MFGSATFSADYLKGPSLPLRYTELAVRIRRRVILLTVGSVTLTHTSGPRESVVGALHRAGVCFVWCGNGSFLPRYERACFQVLTFFPPVNSPTELHEESDARSVLSARPWAVCRSQFLRQKEDSVGCL